MSSNRRPSSFKEHLPAELPAALLFFLFGLFIMHEAGKLPKGLLHSPGPGFFPFWLGCLVASLSLLIIIGLMTGKVRPTQGQWRDLLWQKVAFSSLVLFIYALTLPSIGYPIGTFLLLLLLFRLIEKKNILIVILLSGFVSLGTYVVFKYWLMIQLPRGILNL